MFTIRVLTEASDDGFLVEELYEATQYRVKHMSEQNDFFISAEDGQGGWHSFWGREHHRIIVENQTGRTVTNIHNDTDASQVTRDGRVVIAYRQIENK